MSEELQDLSKFVPGQSADGGAENRDAGAPEKKKGGRRKKADGEEKPKKEPKPKRDNIAEVNALNSLFGVRKKLQIAIAKKAKSAGKPEAEARYQAEIDACRAKLEELMAQTEGLTGSDLVAKLMELDEEPNKIITHYIASKEAEFENWAAAAGGKVTKALLKQVDDSLPASFIQELGLDYEEALMARHEKMDYRMRAVCRKFNFIEDVKAGVYVIKDGKFVDPTKVSEPAPAADPAAEQE